MKIPLISPIRLFFLFSSPFSHCSNLSSSPSDSNEKAAADGKEFICKNRRLLLSLTQQEKEIISWFVAIMQKKPYWSKTSPGKATLLLNLCTISTWITSNSGRKWENGKSWCKKVHRQLSASFFCHPGSKPFSWTGREPTMVIGGKRSVALEKDDSTRTFPTRH